MKVCLLYADRERANAEPYYDTKSIIQDLGLESLFLAAAKAITYENGELKKLEEADPYLIDTMRSVMMVPLASQEEIVFRQEVIADCRKAPDMIRGLYRVSSAMLQRWNELGRGIRARIRQGNPVMKLTTEIRVLHLFCNSLTEVRGLLEQQEKWSRVSAAVVGRRN